MTTHPHHKTALNMVTMEQIEALNDADLAAVYMLVCNRKTVGKKTKREMQLGIACDCTSYRRRAVKAAWAAQEPAYRAAAALEAAQRA